MEARVIDAVAWDIDGTLIDSEPLHHRSLLEASASFGVELEDLPPLAFRGVHMDEVWLLVRDRLPAALDRAVWIEAIEHRYVAGVGQLQPIAGATVTLARLHRANVVQICVSNSSRRIVTPTSWRSEPHLICVFRSASMTLQTASRTLSPMPKPRLVSVSRRRACSPSRTAGLALPRRAVRVCAPQRLRVTRTSKPTGKSMA